MFDPTLNGLMAQIEAKKIVLPAMQRPFVWKEDRVTRLIDSLLRGFPLGTALLWKTSTIQRFRCFQKDVQSEGGITVDFESDDSSERYLVLDGQQRLTSLFVAITGTYNGRRLFVDVLSGSKEEKDPGDVYWDCRFLSEKEAKDLNERSALETALGGKRAVFIRFQDLTKLPAAKAGLRANEHAKKLGLDANQTTRLASGYLQCATVLASKTALQIHLIDEDASEPMPIEEILEIFVRVNSGGLVLQKSDLLMSLLDLKWNDIQPELYRVVKEVNAARPFNITRDDVLKSLLLINGSETRFDRLVADRGRVEALAVKLPALLPATRDAWKTLTVILTDDCKISTERFFRGGHNSLLPFVVYLVQNPGLGDTEKRCLATGIYIALMSGIFAGAEARMGVFARNECCRKRPFPLAKLARLVATYYGITGIDSLLSRHLDLALNIAHGGITADENNPENLQRDHIFPRATLEKAGSLPERTNHYANFHFLRGKDNLNKSDIPPHEWFKKPGEQPSYTDADLAGRLLSWDLLQPGQFDQLITTRSKLIQDRALALFGTDPQSFDRLFADLNVDTSGNS